jgi:4-amino-4-deoxy-L-arabinose transferase-like glycosyltransferase
MKRIEEKTRLIALCLIGIGLLVPALLINLGLMTMIDDEGIRSLVALEMKLSGQYITPTLHGEFYYNKPPLYNWLLLVSFWISGQVTEFSARFPTVLALCGYALTVFLFFRRHFGTYFGLLNAVFLITCGRILLWDSLLGLIDIFFSWVVFVQFLAIYYFFERKDFLRLFLFSYLLMSIGFMLKGLPAIVFQGITLLAWFAVNGAFRRLFSWQHIVGGLAGLALIGSYYLAYAQHNSLGVVFNTLMSESSKRTAVQFGWWRTVLHLFTFPFEMLYHFFPWSFLAVYLLRKDLWQKLKENRLVFFLSVVFLSNILIYWSSVEVYPRYLLMFCPLVFGVFLYLGQDLAEKKSWQFKVSQVLMGFFGLLIAGGSFAPLFLQATQTIPHLWLKTGFLVAASVALYAFYWRWKAQRLLILGLLFLVLRIGFNWFVLPDRNSNDYGDLCRQSSIQQGQKWKNRPLYVYRETPMQWTNSIYLTKTRGAIISVAKQDFEPRALYIVDTEKYPRALADTLGQFNVRHGKTVFYIGTLR